MCSYLARATHRKLESERDEEKGRGTKSFQLASQRATDLRAMVTEGVEPILNCVFITKIVSGLISPSEAI